MIFRTALLLVAVASFVSLPKSSSAAFLIFTNQAAFDSAKSALFQIREARFDSVVTGNMTSSFSLGGIGFVGSTENAPGSAGSPVSLDLAVNAGTTASAPNYLGTNGGFGDFSGGASPNFGDKVTLTIPGVSRAIGLNIVTSTIPDFLSFGRLSVGTTNADTLAGTGGPDLGGGLRSYFVGIVGSLPSDTFSSASVSFTGGGSGFLIDNIGVYAVPEPTSLALVGLASLAGLMRRSRRTS